MGIMSYIGAKKESFRNARVGKAQKDTVERQKELEKLEEERKVFEAQADLAKRQEAEKARISAARGGGFVNKYMNTVKANNTKNIGQPSLFGQNKVDAGYKGMNFNGVGEYRGPFNEAKPAKKAAKKEAGWDPVGNYKGPFAK